MSKAAPWGERLRAGARQCGFESCFHQELRISSFEMSAKYITLQTLSFFLCKMRGGEHTFQEMLVG